MDIQSLTLAGLASIGIVNVISFFKPDLTSEIKFALSFVAAFLVIAFVPVELGTALLEYSKEALIIAFAGSGTYKIATKIGGE